MEKGLQADKIHSWKIGKAYSKIFHDIKPLCTIVGTPMLNRHTQLIEIEMDAIVGSNLRSSVN